MGFKATQKAIQSVPDGEGSMGEEAQCQLWQNKQGKHHI